MSDERVDKLMGRSGFTPVRLAGANITAEGSSGEIRFPALLRGYRPFDLDDTSNPLYGFGWVEAYIDEFGEAQELEGGRASGLEFESEEYSRQPYGQVGYADLVSPVSGETIDGTAGTPVTVTFTTSPVTTEGATSWSILVGTGTSGAESYDIGYEFFIDLGTTSWPISGIPTDGSAFYVTLITTIPDVSDPTVKYEWRIIDGGLAICRDDMNAIQSDALIGPGGGCEDQSASDWVPLDDQFVWMYEESIGQAGDTVYVFELPRIEYWGEIVASSYTDCRYAVKLKRIANDDNDPDTKLDWAARLDGKDKTVTVTNIPEVLDDTHHLPIGMIVRVHMTRGGTYPHLPRYWIDAGGAGAVDGFTGTLPVVNEVCFDQYGCVSGYQTFALQFENGLLVSVDPWPRVACP